MSRAAARIVLSIFFVWLLIAGGILSPGSAAALQPDQIGLRVEAAPPETAAVLQPGQIGLRLGTAPPEKGPGAIVVAVTPGGPAAEEDVRVGDIVREVRQEAVSSPEEVLSLIQAARREGKQSILLLIDRDGDLRFVALRFYTGAATTEASPAAPAPAPFLRLQTAPPGKGPGAIIVEVAPGSPAAEYLRVGDIVREVAQNIVSTGEEAVGRFQQAFRGGNKTVLLLLDRGGNKRFVTMWFPSGGTTAGVSNVPSAPVATGASRTATPASRDATAPTTSPAAPPPVVAAAPRPAKPEPPREIPALGLWLEPGSHANGVMVTSVSTVGRAARAGIRAGDVITSIDHIAIHSADDVVRQMGIGAPSLYASFSLLRNGDRADETVVQVRDPPPAVVATNPSPPVVAPTTPQVVAPLPPTSSAPEAASSWGGWASNLDFDFSISAVVPSFFKTRPSWMYILSLIFGLLFHRNILLAVAFALFLFFNVAVNVSLAQGEFIEYLYRPFYLWFVVPFLTIFDAPASALGLAVIALLPLLSLLLYGGALFYVGPEVRQQEWERVARYLPRSLGQFLGGRPVASAEVMGVPADAEEEEIALARRAVEEAEYGEQRTPSATVTEGPSWWQKRRERREVEQAKLAMARAEHEALRSEAVPAYGGGSVFYPPPYSYSPPPRPLSEWLRTAYWAWKFLIVVVATLWLVWTGQSVLSALGALFPASLRAPVGELLHSFGDMLERSEPPRQ